MTSRPAPSIRARFMTGAMLVTCAWMLALAAPAGAVVRNWNNPAGGSAGTATNWTPNGVPGAADNVGHVLAGNHAISFPTSVPGVISHSYRGSGVVNISTDGPHFVSSSFFIGSGGGGTGMNFTGGDITCDGLFLGLSVSDYGRLTLLKPNILTPVRFEEGDSTQAGSYGTDGRARLEILGGAQFFCTGSGSFAGGATGRCTLRVAGGNEFTSGLSSWNAPNPRRFTFIAQGGQAVANIENGGQMLVAGYLSLGMRSGAFGFARVGGTGFASSTALIAVGRDLILSDTRFPPALGGSSLFQVENRGFCRVGGTVTLGDPDGNSGPATLLMLGGGMAVNGLSIQPAAGNTFDHRGGTFSLLGGNLSWPANREFNVSSSVGSPVFHMLNGITNPLLTVGPGAIGMRIGKGGAGRLRVSQPGTVFGTTGAVVVGDSVTSNGTVEVDSSATFTAGGDLTVGFQGTGTVDIRGGADVQSNLVVLGHLLGSRGTLRVSGPGSSLAAKLRFSVGGNSAAPGDTAVAEFDSSATVTVDPTPGGGQSETRVWNGKGTMRVSNGAVFTTDHFASSGVVELHGGTIRILASSYNAQTNSLLQGHGTLVGGMSNASRMSAIDGGAAEFGSIRVTGDYAQLANGRLRVRLGNTGVPANDSLNVGGLALLNGALELVSDPTYISAPGDSYVVVTAGSISGTFGAVLFNGVLAGPRFQVVYLPTKVVVVKTNSTVGVDDATPSALRFAATGGHRQPRLALDLPFAADARVELFDVHGRRVEELHQGALAAGRHVFAVTGSGRALDAGVYFGRASVMANGRRDERVVRFVMLR